MTASNTLDHEDILRIRLSVLKREHRDLDDAIHALQDRPAAEQFTLRRLKKQKLGLKDQIAQIEDEIFPDIIA
ncbi:YdcH family protein [Oceaniglobus ichthyenteri]|uniref:YdcH family protein n=1 Tax=Oceaniglobus ichthyenteri TaxID=2136177 RepID=UPI000D33E5CE|nr:YdcH family protein [Oceaniglobus ichthyenteri]